MIFSWQLSLYGKILIPVVSSWDFVTLYPWTLPLDTWYSHIYSAFSNKHMVKTGILCIILETAEENSRMK